MTAGFEKKVALVTGAGGGIGEAIAHDLAMKGARVLVVDINGPNADVVAGAIRERGGKALSFCADLSVPEQNSAAVEKAEREFGSLHYAVNNAGIGGRFDAITEIEVDEWRKVMSVNIDAVFLGMKYQLPVIEKSGGGAVVNIASIYAHLGLRRFDAYTASKHAVRGLTRSVAIEYAPRNIRVNAVSPGPILTPLTRGAKEQIETVTAMTAMKRMGEPVEIAKAVSFLLSPDASFITGAEIVVDGGVMLS